MSAVFQMKLEIWLSWLSCKWITPLDLIYSIPGDDSRCFCVVSFLHILW